MIEGLGIKLCVSVDWLVAYNSMLVVFLSMEIVVDCVVMCGCVGLVLYVFDLVKIP